MRYATVGWVLAAMLALLPGPVAAGTLITSPSLVNKTPGPDFHLGTADDGTAAGSVGPNASGANVRGAASYVILKMSGAPANGDDYDFILFLDGTLDLVPNPAASTGGATVLDITGGSLQTTPEFTPGRTGGTLTGLLGSVTLNGDGSAAAQISAQFNDPAFMTAITNQTATAPPGTSLVASRPSFACSGNTYVGDALAPLVPASAGEIVLVEFTGTLNIPCCTGFGYRGVVAVYADGATAATTRASGGACTDFTTCGSTLDGTLPSTGDPDKKIRRTASKLAKLAKAAKTKLAQTDGASAKKQKRLFKIARSRLNSLLSQARKAGQKSRLGVDLATLECVVNAFLARIPAA